MRDVKNGPSPEWLERRLKAIGLRPINALVDVTNLLTIDRARPLHVFDTKKLSGNLHVRYAKDGETLKALNGKEYKLPYVDKMVYRIIKDEATRTTALRTGSGMPASPARSVRSDEE